MAGEDSHDARALPAQAAATPKVFRKRKDATETPGDSRTAKLPALMPALPTLAIDMGDCDTDDKANDYLFGKPKDTNNLLPTPAIMKMNRRWLQPRSSLHSIFPPLTSLVCWVLPLSSGRGLGAWRRPNTPHTRPVMRDRAINGGGALLTVF